jgi:hypothetical protein
VALWLLGILVVLAVAVWLVWKAPAVLAEPAPGAHDAEIAAAATRYAALSSRHHDQPHSQSIRARPRGDA